MIYGLPKITLSMLAKKENPLVMGMVITLASSQYISFIFVFWIWAKEPPGILLALVSWHPWAIRNPNISDLLQVNHLYLCLNGQKGYKAPDRGNVISQCFIKSIWDC
jgi:hypothetical protein